MAEDILSQLKPPAGSTKKRKRVGRGTGSNWGKTAGRGHKGQGSRSGGGVHPRFEGGQMPLQRRLPKRGFHNPFRKEFVVVNVRDLEGFEANSVIDVDVLRAKNLIPKNIKAGVKILGDGEISTPLTIKAHKFSKSARAKIEAAGGTIEVIEGAQ
ncbi:MAG TPA: 50S ribosomal protein L15 [Myxococcales bacterium]|nr:50S ribosomal protein L15 [Deltaproteobacteria bacterium]MBU48326.1 50S ribosomal protein L15 [Deltaproteobacteria bacterium]HAA56981.1 50S ribosomal protein L15 [Myxococcales bacterium]|tara:strand:+ start:54775 stop:55239 length:465 start_codon:yes stop_codon:yes gene_type:complete